MHPIDTLRQSLEDILQRMNEMQQILDDLHQRERKNAVSTAELKPIDWSKMPKGILVSVGDTETMGSALRRFAGVAYSDSPNYPYRAYGETSSQVRCWEYIHLVEQPEVTFWPGGECPVPEGVCVEVYLRDSTTHIWDKYAHASDWSHKGLDGDIIGYRILGLAPGYCNYPGEK